MSTEQLCTDKGYIDICSRVEWQHFVNWIRGVDLRPFPHLAQFIRCRGQVMPGPLFYDLGELLLSEDVPKFAEAIIDNMQDALMEAKSVSMDFEGAYRYDRDGTSVYEDEDGTLWVQSGEEMRSMRVNYCPFTGYKALNQMTEGL